MLLASGPLFGTCLSYFSPAEIEHHDQGNLEKVFVLLCFGLLFCFFEQFQRNKSLSWQRNMAASSGPGRWSKKLRAHILGYKDKAESSLKMRVQSLNSQSLSQQHTCTSLTKHYQQLVNRSPNAQDYWAHALQITTAPIHCFEKYHWEPTKFQAHAEFSGWAEEISVLKGLIVYIQDC